MIYTGFTAVAEFFYHWNVRTPRWLGPVFQRPESHRVHHKRGYHTNNFSRPPGIRHHVGTLRESPGDRRDVRLHRGSRGPVRRLAGVQRPTRSRDCLVSPLHFLPTCIGAASDGHARNHDRRPMPTEDAARMTGAGSRGLRRRNESRWSLGLVGCIQMAGISHGSVALRGIGAATAASPLPKVFSDVDGLETFASEFMLRYRDGREAHRHADHAVSVWSPRWSLQSPERLRCGSFVRAEAPTRSCGNRCIAMGSAAMGLCETNSVLGAGCDRHRRRDSARRTRGGTTRGRWNPRARRSAGHPSPVCLVPDRLRRLSGDPLRSSRPMGAELFSRDGVLPRRV